MRRGASKRLCWLVVLLLLFEWSGAAGWLPRGHAAPPASLVLPSAAELANAGAVIPPLPPRSPASPDELVARSEALVRSIPRIRYDVAARARALGPGVEPAFRFVRDRIRFDAYPGVLRGAEGTYVTRAGNAFDRSLLLADLLKRQGLKTRFALGKLPRPQAERLLTRTFEPAPALEADAVSQAPAFGQAEAEALTARLRARAVRDYAAIRKALGHALPASGGPSREEVSREIEAHVWVQAEVNGTWVDLDAAFPEATPGRTYAAAERSLEALPKETYQRVVIRVTSETLAGGSPKSETALEFSAATEELLDRQIFLTHAPGSGGGGLTGALSGAVAGPDAWAPVLWVDGEFHPGKPIGFGDEKAAERGRPPGGGLRGMFGAGGALAAGAQFLAEWVEFEVVFPDGRRDVTRRALVDRGGAAWRRAGKSDPAGLRPLPRDAQGLLAPRDVHNIWLSAGRHNLADYASAGLLLARWTKAIANRVPGASTSATATRGAPSFGERMWPMAMATFGFLVQSDHHIIPALDSPSHRLYADSPRIFMVSVGLEAAGAGGAHLEGDLRRDRLRGLARDASAEAGLVERKLWFGVLEGALEHETALQYALASGADVTAVRSTSGLLTGEGLMTFRPGAAPGSPLAAGPETAARLADALAQGSVLVVPRPVLRGGPAGWWEIAASGADTRAVLMDGVNGFKIPISLPPTGGGGTSSPPGVIPRDPFPEGPPIPVRSPGVDRPVVRPGKPGDPWYRGPGDPDYGPYRPGGKKQDDCKRGSLPTGGIRVAMAAPLSPGLIDSHGPAPVPSARYLAQGATEYYGVTRCVSVPAVGAVAATIPLWELAVYGVALAVLGYVVGASL